MGLDMFLCKTKKVDGWSIEDYFRVDQFVDENVKSENQLNSLNLEKSLKLKEANELVSCIKQRGEYIKWYSIFEEVGYWRKANQIHQWFVQKVQGGEDECNPYIVSKEQIETLLNSVNMVLNEGAKPEQVLPTQGGFFFGPTNYDEYYFDDLKHTKEILEKVLQETDFDKEILVYQSSW